MATPISPEGVPRVKKGWDVLPSQTRQHQGQFLPQADKISLYHFKETLSEPSQYRNWRNSVEIALKAHKLVHLINSSIERPDNDESTMANNWLAISTLVASWMLGTVSQDTNSKLRATDKRLDLADEVFDAITEEFCGVGVFAECNTATDWYMLKPDDFPLPSIYVQAVRDGWIKMKENGIVLPPFGVLMIIIGTMGDDTLKDMILSGLPSVATERHIMNADQMQRILNDVVGRLQAKEKGPNYQATSRQAAAKTPKAEKEKKTSGGRGGNYKTVLELKDQKNRPGPGISDELHVKAQLNKPQNKDKNCAHCGYLHKTNKCYCLRPDLRPPGWEGPGALWQYKRGTSGGANPLNPSNSSNTMTTPSTFTQDKDTSAVTTSMQATSAGYMDDYYAGHFSAMVVPHIPEDFEDQFDFEKALAEKHNHLTKAADDFLKQAYDRLVDNENYHNTPLQAGKFADFDALNSQDNHREATQISAVALSATPNDSNAIPPANDNPPILAEDDPENLLHPLPNLNDEGNNLVGDLVAAAVEGVVEAVSEAVFDAVIENCVALSSVPKSIQEHAGMDEHRITVPANLCTQQWIMDTGSYAHICTNMAFMDEFHEFKNGEKHEWDSATPGVSGKATGYGKARISFIQDGGHVYDVIINCLFSPGMKFNLFSACKGRRELNIAYNDDTMAIHDRGPEKAIVGRIFFSHGVPLIRHTNTGLNEVNIVMFSAEFAHKRLGHAGQPKMRANEDAFGPIDADRDFHCEACKLGKSKKVVSRTPQTRATRPGQFIHVDLQEVKPMGVNAEKHALVVTDDYSRCRFVEGLKSKAEASGHLQDFCEKVKNSSGSYPHEMRYDGGREFCNFTTWARSAGIRIELSAPYMHEQNGVSEMSGQYLMQIARTMIIDAGAPETLWFEALSTAANITNRLRTRKTQESPMEMWRKGMDDRDQTTSLDHLRIWFCKAYVNVPPEKRVKSRKMLPRAWAGHLVGYRGENGHLYRIYDPIANKIATVRDVAFWEGKDDEKSSDLWQKRAEIAAKQVNIAKFTPDIRSAYRHTVVEVTHEAEDPQFFEVEETPLIPLITAPPEEEPSNSQISPRKTSSESQLTPRSQSPEPAPTTVRKSTCSTRGKRQTTRYGDEDFDAEKAANMAIDAAVMAATLVEDEDMPPAGEIDVLHSLKAWTVKIPLTYREACASQYSDFWMKAMEEQLHKLAVAGAWDEVAYPSEKARILPGKWVFDLKSDNKGFVTQFRARWVICGNRQEQGLDFDESYAPVANDQSVKILYAVAAREGWSIRQFDMVAAYLNAAIDDRIVYMRMPTGFDRKGYVSLIKRALYGLRQAAHLWFHKFKDILEGMGFRGLTLDPCVFVRDGCFIIIYVDDAFVISEDQNDAVIEEIGRAVVIKDLGEPTKFLGCAVTIDKPGNTKSSIESSSETSTTPKSYTIKINQAQYIRDLIDTEGLTNMTSNKIPIPLGTKPLEKEKGVAQMDSDVEMDKTDREHLATRIGKLGWLAHKTRPDISFAVSMLQRAASTPSEASMKLSKQVIRYLKGTLEKGLEFGPHKLKNAAGYDMRGLVGYVDASHANDIPTRRSIDGCVFFYDGTPILWSSKRQQLVAPSSTCAEYIALDRATKDALYLSHLMKEMGIRGNEPVEIRMDSDNAAILAETANIAYKPATKFLDIRYHFVRDEITKRTVKLTVLPSKDNPADGFTKILDIATFSTFVELLGLQ
ncbi:hypothetical protein N7520_009165 [Penicillium odoratum]|uniref:uncharacterized protein n=1 Tax=Penicillium odoratum TaxID=1167516 RepID=UPI0025485A7A|nr:uncharacterized protein N7520_009165 [Penicillium odoratum]KAJ5752248.1 hypothetical protein N7520_009165 [Penicillium odoratum]